MIDKSTVGVTAEPEEVEAALRNLCGYHLAEPDPLFRYAVLTREQVLYGALVAAIKRERGRALAELAAAGHKMTQIAEMTNLTSRQQVQRLIAVARAAEEAVAAVQEASREFEDRLAAVEATLDEVVSGIAPVLQPAIAEQVAAPDAGRDESAKGWIGSAGGRDSAAGRSVRAGGWDDRAGRWDDRAGGWDDQAGGWEELAAGWKELAGEDASAGAVSAVPGPTSAALGAGEPKDDAATFSESTQALPAVRTALHHPTKEMPPADPDTPWWRRGRESKDAKDPGAA
jgi:hypothetical protein